MALLTGRHPFRSKQQPSYYSAASCNVTKHGGSNSAGLGSWILLNPRISLTSLPCSHSPSHLPNSWALSPQSHTLLGSAVSYAALSHCHSSVTQLTDAHAPRGSRTRLRLRQASHTKNLVTSSSDAKLDTYHPPARLPSRQPLRAENAASAPCRVRHRRNNVPYLSARSRRAWHGSQLVPTAGRDWSRLSEEGNFSFFCTLKTKRRCAPCRVRVIPINGPKSWLYFFRSLQPRGVVDR